MQEAEETQHVKENMVGSGEDCFSKYWCINSQFPPVIFLTCLSFPVKVTKG